MFAASRMVEQQTELGLKQRALLILRVEQDGSSRNELFYFIF
jgi:hypothetical protein